MNCKILKKKLSLRSNSLNTKNTCLFTKMIAIAVWGIQSVHNMVTRGRNRRRLKMIQLLCWKSKMKKLVSRPKCPIRAQFRMLMKSMWVVLLRRKILIGQMTIRAWVVYRNFLSQAQAKFSSNKNQMPTSKINKSRQHQGFNCPSAVKIIP